jgi:hypothetical protein
MEWVNPEIDEENILYRAYFFSGTGDNGERVIVKTETDISVVSYFWINLRNILIKISGQRI